jgi:hypothetical protein
MRGGDAHPADPLLPVIFSRRRVRIPRRQITVSAAALEHNTIAVRSLPADEVKELELVLR